MSAQQQCFRFMKALCGHLRRTKRKSCPELSNYWREPSSFKCNDRGTISRQTHTQQLNLHAETINAVHSFKDVAGTDVQFPSAALLVEPCDDLRPQFYESGQGDAATSLADDLDSDENILSSRTILSLWTSHSNPTSNASGSFSARSSCGADEMAGIRGAPASAACVSALEERSGTKSS